MSSDDDLNVEIISVRWADAFGTVRVEGPFDDERHFENFMDERAHKFVGDIIVTLRFEDGRVEEMPFGKNVIPN